MVLAPPFLGLGALSYWLLLAGTDINFYLTERPPRFWIAVVIGSVLVGALCHVRHLDLGTLGLHDTRMHAGELRQARCG